MQIFGVGEETDAGEHGNCLAHRTDPSRCVGTVLTATTVWQESEHVQLHNETEDDGTS